MIRKRQNGRAVGRAEKGFTLLELLISIALTILIMGSVYALLQNAQETFQREPQIVDLQQSARTVLSRVSTDVLQAGAGLPPEFPAFTTPAIDPTVGDSGAPGAPDVVEIIGNLGGPNDASPRPDPIIEFDQATGTVSLFQGATQLRPVAQCPPPANDPGDMVVVYNNTSAPGNPEWFMGCVTAVVQGDGTPCQPQPPALRPPAGSSGCAVVTVARGAVPASYSQLPAAVNFNSGFITPVSVVRYSAVLDASGLFTPPPFVLMRRVNFGLDEPMGYVEDFQVSYIQENPLPEVSQVPSTLSALVGPDIQFTNVVTGVRVSVKGRTVNENLKGAQVADAAQGEVGDYIRKTFSSIVNPRNIIGAIGERTAGNQSGPQFQ
jgi:type II secretory pathway pseudopilin PulG